MSSTTLNGGAASNVTPPVNPASNTAPVSITMPAPAAGSFVSGAGITPESGPTTTEFWTTLLTNVLAVVIALGTVFNGKFDFRGAQPLIPAVAMLAAAGVTSWYAHSRGTVKAAAHTATGIAIAAAEGALPPA